MKPKRDVSPSSSHSSQSGKRQRTDAPSHRSPGPPAVDHLALANALVAEDDEDDEAVFQPAIPSPVCLPSGRDHNPVSPAPVPAIYPRGAMLGPLESLSPVTDRIAGYLMSAPAPQRAIAHRVGLYSRGLRQSMQAMTSRRATAYGRFSAAVETLRDERGEVVPEARDAMISALAQLTSNEESVTPGRRRHIARGVDEWIRGNLLNDNTGRYLREFLLQNRIPTAQIADALDDIRHAANDDDQDDESDSDDEAEHGEVVPTYAQWRANYRPALGVSGTSAYDLHRWYELLYCSEDRSARKGARISFAVWRRMLLAEQDGGPHGQRLIEAHKARQRYARLDGVGGRRVDSADAPWDAREREDARRLLETIDAREHRDELHVERLRNTFAAMEHSLLPSHFGYGLRLAWFEIVLFDPTLSPYASSIFAMAEMVLPTVYDWEDFPLEWVRTLQRTPAFVTELLAAAGTLARMPDAGPVAFSSREYFPVSPVFDRLLLDWGVTETRARSFLQALPLIGAAHRDTPLVEAGQSIALLLSDEWSDVVVVSVLRDLAATNRPRGLANPRNLRRVLDHGRILYEEPPAGPH